MQHFSFFFRGTDYAIGFCVASERAGVAGLATALRVCHISKKPKRVEKVRLAGRIRTNKEDSLLKFHVYVTKVPPVFQT